MDEFLPLSFWRKVSISLSWGMLWLSLTSSTDLMGSITPIIIFLFSGIISLSSKDYTKNEKLKKDAIIVVRACFTGFIVLIMIPFVCRNYPIVDYVIVNYIKYFILASLLTIVFYTFKAEGITSGEEEEKKSEEFVAVIREKEEEDYLNKKKAEYGRKAKERKFKEEKTFEPKKKGK